MNKPEDSQKCQCEKCKQYEAIWLCPSCELGLLWAAVAGSLGWAAWQGDGWGRMVVCLALSFALFRCVTIFRSHPHH